MASFFIISLLPPKIRWFQFYLFLTFFVYLFAFENTIIKSQILSQSTEFSRPRISQEFSHQKWPGSRSSKKCKYFPIFQFCPSPSPKLPIGQPTIDFINYNELNCMSVNSDLTRNYLNGTLPLEWASLPLVNMYALFSPPLIRHSYMKILIFISENADLHMIASKHRWIIFKAVFLMLYTSRK